jgi:hypothetical protein
MHRFMVWILANVRGQPRAEGELAEPLGSVFHLGFFENRLSSQNDPMTNKNPHGTPIKHEAQNGNLK